MFWLLAFAVAAEKCAHPVTLLALSGMLERSLVAYSDGQLPQFEASLREAEANLRCLQEPIDRATSADLHLAEALHRRQAGLTDSALYLAAWRATTMDSLQSPLMVRLVALDPWLADPAPAETPSLSDLPPPWSGDTWVDGRVHAPFIQAEPYVFQQVLADGHAKAAVYVRPGQKVPQYTKLRPVLTTVAISGIVLGATGLIVADETKQRLAGEDWTQYGGDTPPELVENRIVNNYCFVIGISASALGLASGAWLAWSYR